MMIRGQASGRSRCSHSLRSRSKGKSHIRSQDHRSVRMPDSAYTLGWLGLKLLPFLSFQLSDYRSRPKTY